jgi:Tfp pilus assembly PilM family ATPase
MLASSSFFKLFPPPRSMLMPHAGLDISDDAIRVLAYSGFGKDRHVSLYDSVDLPVGLLEGGDCKDEKELISRLADFGRRHGLSYVKISIPEEKAYLFQTDVPDLEASAIKQNIESKLEENVPLSASDAMFYFDLLPSFSVGGRMKANVTAVPRTYIEHHMSLLESAGLSPVAFEISPKAIARAVVPDGTLETRLIIHLMDKKTGIYIVSGSATCFASTVAICGGDIIGERHLEAVSALSKEISRVHSYWDSHGNGQAIIEAIFVGRGADTFHDSCQSIGLEAPIVCRTADVWVNAFNVEKRLPPISRSDSLCYAVTAGLAFDLASGA